MRAYDARCHACNTVHIVTLGDDAIHRPGEVIGFAHITGRTACGEYADHTIEAALTGI